jgi:anti-sigma-K factor RskA
MADQETPHHDVTGYALGILEPEQVAAFELHLAMCADCRAQLDELQGLSRLLEEAAAPPFEVPTSLREKTFAAVERATAQQDAQEEQRNRGATKRPRFSRAVAVLGAAAGVLGLVLGLSLFQPEPAFATVALVSPTGGPEHGTARGRTTPAGQVVDLKLTAMPATAPDRYYECWFVGDGDTVERPDRVSAGTFVVHGRGRLHVRVNSAAGAARYPRMAVTLEPLDGNPARTGGSVLVSE